MKDHINDAILAAQNMLKNFPPFDEVDSDSGEENNDRLPFDNLDASPQSSGDGHSTRANHSHPDKIKANEMLRTELDQGEPEQESESDQEADPEYGGALSQGSDYTLMFR